MQYVFVLVFLKANPRRSRVVHFLVRGVRVHAKWRELAHKTPECRGWQHGCGERWLFESDGIAGCGKTSAAYVTARALGCDDFAIERIDSRATSVADLRELDSRMQAYGFGGNGRRCFIIDEIQHLNRDCQRMLLGILENLPNHVIVIATTTSVTWADDVDGLYSRWRRFRFRKPSAQAVAEHVERIARDVSLPIPDGFRWLSYVQGKCGVEIGGNNIRAAIDLLPDVLRRFKAKSAAEREASVPVFADAAERAVA